MSSVSETGAGPADAALTTYTPATPGNWSPTPITVKEALDQVAANANIASLEEIKRYALLVGGLA